MFVWFFYIFNTVSYNKSYNRNTYKYISDSPENNKFIELEKVIQLLQQQYNKAALGGNKQQVANN